MDKRIGGLSVEIHCDSSKLDAALAKMDLLIERGIRARELGTLPEGALAVSGALVVGAALEQKLVTRRGLLGLGWLFRD